jgi:short-subunit dehydrogenase
MAASFRNILITGASNGLGEALARLYAAPGIQLALTGRNADRLTETARYCEQQGATVTTAIIDVQDRDTLSGWVTATDQRWPLDLIIANAGVMHVSKADSPQGTREQIDEILAVNFTGVITTVNPILDRMALRGKGSVAIISSLSAYRGLPLFPAYAASKAAIKSYYEGLRGVYEQKGVHITVVCPSYIRTPMTSNLRTRGFMQMDVRYAAARIKQALERHKPLLTFPLHHSLGLQLLRFMPERLADRILLLLYRI